MSKPKLVDPRDTTGIDVTGLLAPQHRAFLDSLSTLAVRSGMRMGPDDDDDEDGDDDGEDDDEALELEPDTLIKIKIGGKDKELTVAELQRIAAKEKREGKKAGQRATLVALGFESIEEAQEALKGAKKPAKKKTGTEDDGDDDRATERETAAEARERKAADKERRADLRGALRDAGVPRDDLDDAMALLDRAVDTEYDDDDLEDAVEELKGRRPALFGEADDEGDEEDEKPKPKAKIPSGRGPKRRNQPKRKFGQGGLERAKRDGFIKD